MGTCAAAAEHAYEQDSRRVANVNHRWLTLDRAPLDLMAKHSRRFCRRREFDLDRLIEWWCEEVCSGYDNQVGNPSHANHDAVAFFFGSGPSDDLAFEHYATAECIQELTRGWQARVARAEPY
jgi:hypothetical protein